MQLPLEGALTSGKILKNHNFFHYVTGTLVLLVAYGHHWGRVSGGYGYAGLCMLCCLVESPVGYSPEARPAQAG